MNDWPKSDIAGGRANNKAELLRTRYYWFRVTAIGAADQGPCSNPLHIIVG
jgi:hypothetical protein